ncbi:MULTISPECIES: phage baseplate upper protein [unclassified Enterococcus]|uniref:phage baseplate upper protein n=1 Tax=unclassified Enterococcus TaxID=2608891 RepID=UPI003F265F20
MNKWTVTLSTTEPFNYVGILKVRQGNKNTERLEATIIQNGLPIDLTDCRVTFQTIIGGYPVERPCKILRIKGVVEYVFDEYTMQKTGRHIANIAFYKGDDLIGTTQDFSYFVINAVSKTPGEMGSYWQTVEDLLNDMREYLNANKGDFESWFESIKEILATIDPGGTLLNEVLDARVDSTGKRHDSIQQRLHTDFLLMEQRIKEKLYALPEKEISILTILQDDQFSKNHTVERVGTVKDADCRGELVIAHIGISSNDYFHYKRVGEIDG